MKISKKCPHCGHWDDYQGLPDDTCSNCNQMIHPEQVQEIEKYKDFTLKYREKLTEFYFPIRPNDNFFIIILKAAVNTVGVIYTVILSFIIAIIALLPG